MTIALWCVLAAGLLPYLASLIARGDRKGYDHGEPRAWLAQQNGYQARAAAAELNCFEIFPFFSAATILAHLLRGAQPLVDLLAVAFIATRVLYVAFYLVNRPYLRSLAWAIGIAVIVAIFIIAAL